MTDQASSDKFSKLRKQAEQTIKEELTNIVFFSPAETVAIIHDLQVHQAELEIQNEELLAAQEELEASRRKYTDLYEFSPVGLLTLDNQGVIKETNLTFARLMGIEREKLLKHDLSDFIDSASQDPFHLFFQTLRNNAPTQHAEITLLAVHNLPVRVRLEGMIVLQDDSQATYRLAISDMTEQYRIELEKTRLYAAEQIALARSERLTFRLGVLQAFTATLSEAITQQQVVDAIINGILRALGAAFGSVALLTENELWLEYQPSARSGNLSLEDETRIALKDTLPLTDAVRNQQVVWLSDLKNSDYPEVIKGSTHIQALVCLPLSVKGRKLGGFEICFTRPHTFTDEEKMFVLSLVNQGALALDRAQLARQIAVSEERHWLAQELHDAATQTIFTTSILAQAIPVLWQKDPEKAQAQLTLIGKLAQSALAEMRTLLVELRPEGILRTSLQILLTQLAEATQSRKVLEVALDLKDHIPDLPPTIHIAFYRIAQESINNVVKHSGATHLAIRLYEQANQLILSVQDNGQGFNVLEETLGFGLGMMEERAENIGAVLKIESRVGDGTRIELIWEKPFTT